MAIARKAGAFLNLLNGLWAGYISLAAINTPSSCPPGGCPVTVFTYLPTGLLAVAVLLVIDAVVCFLGLRVGFAAGAILSVVAVVLVVSEWGTYGTFSSSLSVALSAIATLIDVISARSGKGIPEESHPLNLPVFG